MQARRSRALIAVAVAFTLVTLLPAADAHADLVAIDPPINLTHHVEAPPTRFVLTFTEPLDPSSTTFLFNSTGRMPTGPPVVDSEGMTMTLNIPFVLEPGAYSLRYSALSTKDGHPKGATIGFTLGSGFVAPPSSVDSSDPTLSAISKATLYTGLAIALASIAFLLWMPGFDRETARRALLFGCTLHFVGLLFLFRTAYLESGVESIGLYLQPTDGVGRVYMMRAILAGGAFILAFIGYFRGTRTGPYAVGALLLGAAWGSSRLGHSSEQGWAALSMDLTHLVAASLWVGGLLLFVAMLRRGRADPPDVVRRRGIRFGTMAMVSVIIIAITGVILTVFILGAASLGNPANLLTFEYGRYLGAKVGLAMLMVALAGINRYVFLEGPQTTGMAGLAQRGAQAVSGGRVQPGIADGRHLGRTVTVEATLAVIVMLVAGFLTSVSPPATAAATPAAPLTLEGGDADYEVHLTLTPGPRQGSLSTMELHIYRILENGTQQPMLENTCGRTSCVSVTFQYGTDPAEPPQAAQLHPDSWAVGNIAWTKSGAATMTVNISDPPVFERAVVLPLNVP